MFDLTQINNGHSENLSLSHFVESGDTVASDTPPPVSDEKLLVVALKKTDPGRLAAERLIADQYKAHFGIEIAVDYPVLFSLQQQSGEMISTVGIRCAGDGPLFLEQYLNRSIEQELERGGLGRHQRHSVVELGSLASVNRRASLYLISAMAAYMHAKDYAVATVTGTERLRRMFSLFELDLTKLASASRSQLKNPDADWGTYYDDDPQVLAASVPHCFDAAVINARESKLVNRSGTLEQILSQVQKVV